MSNNLSASNGPGRPKDLAKRQAILDAAKNLFLSNGYANTSMDAVASAAGVSKLTVYSHFNDKERLFSAAVVAKCEEQLPTLFFELPDGIPIEQVLLNIARRFHLLINSDESVNLHRLIMALGSQDPKLSQIFSKPGRSACCMAWNGYWRRSTRSAPCASTNHLMPPSIFSACSRVRRIFACSTAAARP